MKKTILIGLFLLGVSVLAIDNPGVIRQFNTVYAAWDNGRIWDRLSGRNFIRWLHSVRNGSQNSRGQRGVLSSSPVPNTANCPQTSFTRPRLTNPVNPKNYGAAGNGTSDDTKAFQAAVNAGDVLVPAGTYLINHTVIVKASHRHIQCEPGVMLMKTVREDSNMFNFEGPSTGNSLVGCTFVGANPTRIRDWDHPGHYDI